MTVEWHIITTKDVQTAGRRLCAWVNRPEIELLSVCQLAVDDQIQTTIFWRRAGELVTEVGNSQHRYRVRTGEKRLKRKLLKIDKLPNSVHSAIVALRKQGKIWPEIARLSGQPYAQNWASGEAGFVDWSALSAEVLSLFPARNLPQTSLQRWYDLRVEQGANSACLRATEDADL